MKFVTRSGFFKRGPNKDGHLDPDTIQTISKKCYMVNGGYLINNLPSRSTYQLFQQVCFRELCGLCWMLHVRDQLSTSCRKYQAARQQGRDEQVVHLIIVMEVILSHRGPIMCVLVPLRPLAIQT